MTQDRSRTVRGIFTLIMVCAVPTLAPVAVVLAANAQQDAQQEDSSQSNPLTPSELASQILDEQLSAERREELVRDGVRRAAEVVRAMVADLPEDDEAEEYRRIPWIWRVSIAAGRQQDEQVLLPLLKISLPEPGEPFRDWQSVVLGGGIINGLSLEGRWPREVIEEWLSKKPELAPKWKHTMKQAQVMTDNERVRKGTRYDAQRVLGVATWDETGAQLLRYLPRETDGELQMGAVSGLSDIQHPRAAQALLEHLPQLTPGNRRLALDALLRSPERKTLLREAIQRGQVEPDWLSEQQSEQLLDSSTP